MKMECNKEREMLKKMTHCSTGNKNFSVKLKAQWKLSPKKKKMDNRRTDDRA